MTLSIPLRNLALTQIRAGGIARFDPWTSIQLFCAMLMAEGNLSVDHVTIWRWVQRYVPVLTQRLRHEMRRPNGSWRVDETYVKVAGNWAYLYRALDSAGETIEFMLSPKRDLIAEAVPEARVIPRWPTATRRQRGWASGLYYSDRLVEAGR